MTDLPRCIACERAVRVESHWYYGPENGYVIHDIAIHYRCV